MPVFDHMHSWLADHLPAECPSDTELGGWFLTPAAHLMEMAMATLIFTAMLRVNWKLVHSKRSKLTARLLELKRNGLSNSQSVISQSNQERLKQHDQEREAFDVMSWSNLALVAILSASWFLIIFHKWQKDRMWFMLQPCHILHGILILITLMRPSNPVTTFMFNVYVQVLFSPFLGLVAADVTCYKMPLELANWFVQHVLLLVTPLYFLITNRFPLVTGLPFFFLSFSIEVLYHSLIVVPASVLTGYNINYVLCPPPGLLASFGANYRKLMLAACAVLAFFFRMAVFQFYSYLKSNDPAFEYAPDVIDIAPLNEQKLAKLQKALEDEVDEEDENSDTLRKRAAARN